mmetsp:Transcript_55914/g.114275  ORF Transcript_55914/g.114275 Transcript_55914/m.114275 type:complete len:88 (+) Transcript_55914:6340-6603(+)
MKESLPLKVLQEGKPFVVTIETKNGQNYRGKLIEVEENMNCRLQNASLISCDGIIKKFNTIFLRGSNLRIIILPDLIKETPMFEKKI